MIEIYKNLHKSKHNNSVYSVRRNNKVIRYSSYFELTNCIFKVRKGGRKRVLEEQKKNVHAFIKSEYMKSDLDPIKYNELLCTHNMELISYNPYKFDYFYYLSDLKRIDKSEKVYIFNNNIYANR